MTTTSSLGAGDARTNLAWRFHSRAVSQQGRTALVIDDERWSYGELLAAAWRLSTAASRAVGREPAGDAHRPPAVMAALGGRRFGQYVASLAAPLGGWVFMPLSAADPVTRIAQMLRRERPEVLVVDEAGAASLPELLPLLDAGLQVFAPGLEALALAVPAPHVLHDDAALRTAAHDPRALPAACAPRTPAYLLFTSGSTGIPKGVPLTHGNLGVFLENALFRLAPGPEDRFGQISNLNWDVGIFETHVAWAAGACVHRLPDQLIRVPAYVHEHALSHWFSTPSVAGILNDLHVLQSGALKSLRHTVFAGEALSAALARQWQFAAPASVIENFYGPTEASVVIACHRWRPGDPDRDFVPFGEALPGQLLEARDEHGRPVEDGTRGELFLAGSQVVDGYWRDAAESARRFELDAAGRRWYRTGDLVVRTERGWRFEGRLDDQLKVQGYRVERLEVETLLREAAGSQFVAVVTLPLGGESGVLGLHGVVSASPHDAAAILRRCRERMPSYMVPTAIHLRELPRGSTGKVDYRQLQAQLLAGGPPGADR